jgi:hypothetical protein
MPIDQKDTLGALIEFYKEQCEHGRHTESQRQQVSTLLLSITTALIGLMGALKFSPSCLPLALSLILVGVFGWFFMGKYELKWEETKARRKFYREEIQAKAEVPDPATPRSQTSREPGTDDDKTETKSGKETKSEGKESKSKGKGTKSEGTLRKYWKRIFIGVVGLGVIFTAIVIWNWLYCPVSAWVDLPSHFG